MAQIIEHPNCVKRDRSQKISENTPEISSFSNQTEMNRSQWKALLSWHSRAEKLISSGVCLERKPGSGPYGPVQTV